MTTTQETTTVPMPALGENVTEGTVTRWLKQIGDTVDIDEPLLEVATDKVDTEIASPVAGVLVDIIADEDAVVEIGAPLALVAVHGTAQPEADITPQTQLPTNPDPQRAIVPASDEKCSTATRTISADRPALVDSSSRTSPGAPEVPNPGTSDDAGAVRVEKLPRIRRTIAARMVESLHTAAQLTTVVEVDIARIAALRRDHKTAFHQRTGHKLSYLPFLTKSAVESLESNPVINSALDSDVTEVTYHRSVHLGMAVDSAKGLMVPVIRNAQNMTITELAHAIAAAAESVRTGKVGADDLTGGTFTITNTGSRGALFDTPIINQPQSAILGTGAVVERLKPAYDAAGNLTIAVVPTVHLSLSYDHRIVDGADAARYLTDVKDRLEKGYTAADLT
ncbi:2-oxo acid dehydrogenase subunit E2 [Rhodococcus sp. B10]|uniref:2-oxo acid dehydrogenase subunit E2 n=1 Tax=Rhodococcus sp. B10 TaxID=2695876 RepID=UPI001430ED01|nr:2-oxo acid dehydrogenase subunit E2 [Rhodococcus sp. B10]NIL74165.1 hypothetical protein [Rhodococcus sp. B10]